MLSRDTRPRTKVALPVILVIAPLSIHDQRVLGDCSTPPIETVFPVTVVPFDLVHWRDRQTILDACIAAGESRIMITHGTDTMELTASFLADRITDKTIVLTGAMIPCAFGSSDGLFNFGSALSFAQVLPPGVFIAMNGCLFEAGDVYKDRQLGIFRKRSDSGTP